jgi:hypothetical protein
MWIVKAEDDRLVEGLLPHQRAGLLKFMHDLRRLVRRYETLLTEIPTDQEAADLDDRLATLEVYRVVRDGALTLGGNGNG